MGVSPCLVEVQVQVVRNVIPNPAGTYLIRRALKNDSDPYHECSKRSHERQVMMVFVEAVIRRSYEVATKMEGCCFEIDRMLLRK